MADTFSENSVTMSNCSRAQHEYGQVCTLQCLRGWEINGTAQVGNSSRPLVPYRCSSAAPGDKQYPHKGIWKPVLRGSLACSTGWPGTDPAAAHNRSSGLVAGLRLEVIVCAAAIGTIAMAGCFWAAWRRRDRASKSSALGLAAGLDAAWAAEIGPEFEMQLRRQDH